MEKKQTNSEIAYKEIFPHNKHIRLWYIVTIAVIRTTMETNSVDIVEDH